MTHLKIELNTITENVTSNVIHKLYETAKAIIDAEEANEVEESLVSLKGNLLVSKAYGDEIDWLETKFPDLHITAGARYIRFADPEVLRVLLANNIGDGTGVTNTDAAAITSIDGLFKNNTTITSFNELRYFTNDIRLTNGAFLNTSNLLSIDLSTATYLSERCFAGSGITGVINLTKATYIQGLAFNKCINITEVNFGVPSVNMSGGSIFAGCSNLLKVTGLSNITTVQEGMFNNCLKLNDIDIDFSKITRIYGSAFLLCKLLTSADLSSCTSIGELSFYGCTSLTSVTLPSTAIAINYDTFRGCSKLASINLSNVTSIGDNAFSGCTSLTSVDLSNCSSIGSSAFLNSLNGATISLARLMTVSYGGLRGCKMSSVTNLGSISSVPESFLTDCPNLTSVTLPVSCTTLTHDAIKDNPLLTSINVENLITIGSKNFTFTPGLPEVMHFPNVTTFVSYQDALGYIGSTGIKYLYLPKLTAGGKGLDYGGNNVIGMFVPGGWSDQCHTKYIVYFKDLSSLTTGAFCGTAIRNLVINNVTPPTVTANTTVVTNDLLNSTQPRSTITNVYVPDAAVSTYQSTAYWLDMNIVSMNNLNKVATKALWDALPNNDKIDTLIEEYM